MNAWRCMLLRTFGAKVGRGTFIHPSAKIWFPWNLIIGDHSGIGFDALIYNLSPVRVGDFSTISQRVHINTGSHEYRRTNFPLVTSPGEYWFWGFCWYRFIHRPRGYHRKNGCNRSQGVLWSRTLATTPWRNGHPCRPTKTYEMIPDE